MHLEWWKLTLTLIGVVAATIVFAYTNFPAKERVVKLEETIPTIQAELKEQRKISCAIALAVNAKREAACLR